MKKILLLAAAAAAYYAYKQQNQTKDEVDFTPDINPVPGPMPISDYLDEANQADIVFKMYDNQVIEDANGYWMLVKNGKLYSPLNENTLIAWQRQNPNKPGVIQVDFSVWEHFANNGADVFGGSF